MSEDDQVPEPRFETLDDEFLSSVAIAFATIIFGLFVLLLVAIAAVVVMA